MILQIAKFLFIILGMIAFVTVGIVLFFPSYDYLIVHLAEISTALSYDILILASIHLLLKGKPI